MVIFFAAATVVAFVLLHNSWFNFPCYTLLKNAYSEIGLEVMLRPLATSCAKDYKGHSLVQTCYTELPNRCSGDAHYSGTTHPLPPDHHPDILSVMVDWAETLSLICQPNIRGH